MKLKLTDLLVLLALTFCVTNSANAQEDKKPTIDIFGFIRVDAYMDTYKGQDLGHDIFYLLPQYAKVGRLTFSLSPIRTTVKNMDQQPWCYDKTRLTSVYNTY